MPEFVPFERWITLPPASPDTLPEACDEVCTSHDGDDEALGEELRSAVRRFRAAMDEALERRVRELVREIAVDVVARELRLQPCDVAAVVRGARERFPNDEPLRVRVNPADAGALAGLDVPVFPDGALRRGDVEIDVRDGTIDATLGARLEALLER